MRGPFFAQEEARAFIERVQVGLAVRGIHNRSYSDAGRGVQEVLWEGASVDRVSRVYGLMLLGQVIRGAAWEAYPLKFLQCVRRVLAITSSVMPCAGVWPRASVGAASRLCAMRWRRSTNISPAVSRTSCSGAFRVGGHVTRRRLARHTQRGPAPCRQLWASPMPWGPELAATGLRQTLQVQAAALATKLMILRCVAAC